MKKILFDTFYYTYITLGVIFSLFYIYNPALILGKHFVESHTVNHVLYYLYLFPISVGVLSLIRYFWICSR